MKEQNNSVKAGTATETNSNTLNRQNNTIKLAKMGMLVAISVILVYVHFPIFRLRHFWSMTRQTFQSSSERSHLDLWLDSHLLW